MKRIIIVNNNMDSGGIQKALINLLKAVSDDYEITLLLFSRTGALMDEIPSNVKVVTPSHCYKMLGLAKKELLDYPILFALKAVFKILTKFFGKRKTLKMLGLFQKKYEGYDIAISFSHLTSSKIFENGAAEFVLDKIVACRKTCFVHCDYSNSGTYTLENNKIYSIFDDIICVSNSVRERLVELVPGIVRKTFVIRNFYDMSVSDKAKDDPIYYDDTYINIVIVARLSREKGQDRAIYALKESKRNDIKLHLVGDGPFKEELTALCEKLDLLNEVSFYGEQTNPYRYMTNADYLLVPSVHEAAPMVFDEAHSLGLRVISTKLLSSSEMLFEDDIECENSKEGIKNALLALIKSSISDRAEISNQENIEKFANYVEGRL